MVGRSKIRKRNKEWSLKAVLVFIAVFFAVCTCLGIVVENMIVDDYFAGMAPNSKHYKVQPVTKSEMIYAYTDATGKVESATAEVYLKNNPEKNIIKDKSNLRGVSNTQETRNLPTKINDGMLVWNAHGKDVEYEGNAPVNKLPIKMDVRYYINGRPVAANEVKGSTGKLKIAIRYKSMENIVYNEERVKVPYFAVTAISFGTECNNINVSNGNVIGQEGYRIAVGTVMPGTKELLGAEAVRGINADNLTITAEVKKFKGTDIVTVASGDVLSKVDDKVFSALNFDKKVDKLDAVSRKIVGISKMVAKGVLVTDKKVMPEIKKTTKTVKKTADKVSKEMPSILTKIKETSGEIAASVDVVVYGIKEIKKIIGGFEEYNAAEQIDEIINGQAGEEALGLSEKLKQNMAMEEETLESLEPDNPARAALEQSIAQQGDILETLEGNEEEQGLNEIAEETAKEEDKLKEIMRILYDEEWVKEVIESGDVTDAMTEEEKKIYEQYIERLKDDGKYQKLEDIIADIPKKNGSAYNTVESLMSKDNTDSVISMSKKIADAMGKVDKLTGTAGSIVHKVSLITNNVSSKVSLTYRQYVSVIVKAYNKNMRGLSSNLEAVKYAQLKSQVYTGLEKGMKGSSMYMYVTPIE